MLEKKGIKVTYKKFIKRTVILMVIVLVGLVSGEIIANYTINAVPKKSEELDTERISTLLFYLEYPEKAEEDGIVIDDAYVVSAVLPTKRHLDCRYDCSDFMTPTLLRLVYKYGDYLQSVSPEGYALIKESVLGFKYWVTEPGKDSMCFWSENHQILFAVAEYLASKMWPSEVFTNDGTTGKEHFERAAKRINFWMEQRYYYGFSEFNSSNYLQFNLGPMANFIEFGGNNIMVERMKMVMDIALYDLASNLYKYAFIAPAGRAYVYNMAGEDADNMRKFTDYIWGLNEDWKDSNHRMLLNFISMMEGTDSEGKKFYKVPEVIKEIGSDDSAGISKSSTGLDVSELEAKGLIGHSDEQIMMQLAMEALTNPEILKNTLTYFSDNGLLYNDFFNYFKYLNLTVIKTGNVARKISEKFNPMPNGIALQRANIYTYSTPLYQFSTAQNYHPGSYGATQMLSVATFGGNAVAFTTHPAMYYSSKNATAFPGYWAGFGRAPSSVQYENVQLSIYKLPKKSGFLELYDVPQFTHTYLPEAYFDEVIVDGRYAFARVGDAYLSLTGAYNLEYTAFDYDSAASLKVGLENFPDKSFDLIQNGLNQYWIYDLGDSSKETFEEFKVRIKLNLVEFDGENNLVYQSAGKAYSLEYDAEFAVNGEIQNLEYGRFEGDYSNTARESDIITITFGGKTLMMNWLDAKRTIE